MAKKQTFESKLNKSDNKQGQIKLIRSQLSGSGKSL